MSTTLLSTLSRGYGSWTGSIDSKVSNHDLLSHDSSHLTHRHGVRLAARPQTALSGLAVADGGHLDLPKTYLTRKGALMLFTAPDEESSESLECIRPKTKIRKQKKLIDLSLKLKTLERLSLSILQFGEKSYDKESASISDKDNNLFVNFLHDLNQEDCDFHSQPGADLKFYLKDLKRRASCRTHRSRETSLYRARTSELQDLLDELEEAWPHQKERSYSSSGEDFFYSPSPTPSLSSVRALSSRRVLSSKKLAGSLKSVNYMGRSLASESALMLKAATGKNVRCKSAATSESSNSETAQKKRPQTAQSLQRNTSSTSDMEDNQSKSSESSVTKDRTSSHLAYSLEDLNTSKQEADNTASDVEVSDNEWYENTIRVGKTLKSSTSDETKDDETVLVEAATILSSLVEDEDIDVPFGDYSEEEDFYEWPENEQKLDQKDQLFSSDIPRHSPIAESSSLTQTSRIAESSSLTHPLHPQYLNVMNESENIPSLMSRGEHDHAFSRASLGTPFPSTRGASPIADENQIPVQTESVQKVISVTIGDSDLSFKKQEEKEAKLAAMDYLLKPSSKVQETVSLQQQDSVVVPVEIPVTTDFIENSIPEPLAPKRRAKPIEIKTAVPAEEENKDSEVMKTTQSDFSERVVREKEEKERRSANLREEKEKAEAKKRDEQEKIKQEKEEKIRAAEERLKRKAEESARKKETAEKERESKNNLHEGEVAKRLQDTKEPSPPKMEKKRSAFKGKEIKPEQKKTTQQINSNTKQETESVKPVLNKLVNASANATNRQKIVVQKKEPEVPEHLKEMFARKSAQETETEMEEEIIKMKRAVDNVLGTSVTEVEESEGFTEEDFKAAQEALKEKIKKAEEDILQNTSARIETSTALKKTKPEKLAPVPRRGKIKIPDIKKDALRDREMLREQQRLEKQNLALKSFQLPNFGYFKIASNSTPNKTFSS
ncbi:hypothetical protein Btru_000349 [Bulinus truncatus]|nr:hypothetical protein Btru_000349 [Bulinus truncatus]